MDTFEAQKPLLDRFLRERPARAIDLGAGLGQHARYLLEHGMTVTAVDRVLTESLAGIVHEFADRAGYVQSDLSVLPFADGEVEAVWACHCLEHMEHPLAALREWRRVLRPDGLLAVTVPPCKTEIVGRHVFTGWNVGQLMVTLLRAGYEIANGSYAEIGYNVFALVRPNEDPPVIEPNDDLLALYADFFPPAIREEIQRNQRPNSFGETISCFEGRISRLNW